MTLSKWDQRYQEADPATAQASQTLRLNEASLAEPSTALDLACGLGGNAIFLAERGWKVDAVDASQVVTQKLASYANEKQLRINAIQRDIEKEGLLDAHYDLITVSYYLYRPLFSALLAALNPGGQFIYQTWTVNKPQRVGPSNPSFLLKENELLQLCKAMHIVYYQELSANIGSSTKTVITGQEANQPTRGEAAFVAVK